MNDRRTGTAAVVVTSAASVALGTQAMRVLFPALFAVREARGATAAVGIGLAVFAAPFAAASVRRAFGPGPALGLTLASVAAGSIAIQLAHPAGPWLPAATAAAALCSWTLLVHASRSRRPADGAAFALGALAGVGVGAAVHAAFLTWDPPWRSDPAAVATTLVLAATTVVPLPPMLRSIGRERRELPMPAVLSLAAVGGFWLLQLLLLQNVATVTARGGVRPSVAAVAILAGDVAAVALAARSGAAGGSRSGPPLEAAVAGAALVGAVVALAASATGWIVVASAFLAAAATGPLLRSVLTGGHGPWRTGSWRTSVAVGVGTVGAFLGALAVQIDVVRPLPVPVEAIPVMATVVMTAGAVSAAWTSRGDRRVSTRTDRPLAIAVVGALVAASIVAVSTVVVAEEAPAASPHRGRSITVVSWNVHAAVDREGRLEPDAVADAIDRWSPDVVVLQEVARGWPIAGTTDLASWLSRRFEMPFVFGPAADDEFGNLVLTSAPIVRTEVVALPYGSGPQHRSAVVVDLRIGGETLTVVGTHLEAGSVATRRVQIAAVLAEVDRAGEALVAGDMNLQPTDAIDVDRFLDAGLRSAQDDAGLGGRSTARDPAGRGDRPDWIFVTGGLAVRRFAIGASDVSDHLPLVTTVRMGSVG